MSDDQKPHPLDGRFEPESHIMGQTDAALVSMAVSLKRIADTLTSPNMYGESGSEAIANSIWRGLQDGYRPS